MTVLLFLFAGFALAANDAVLEKAQEALLAKNRSMAAKILISAIQQEKPQSPNSKKWLRGLNDLNELFFTEKAQKRFLEIESQPFEQRRAMLDQMEEIKSMEPGNAKVLRSLIALRFQARDCSAADRLVGEALDSNPFVADLYLLRVQTLICLDKINDVKDLLGKQTDLLKGVKTGFEFVNLWLALAKHQTLEVKKRLLEIYSLDNSNPEVIYLGLKHGAFNDGTKESMITRYLDQCGKNALVVRKNYPWLPGVCTQRKEVEEMRGT